MILLSIFVLFPLALILLCLSLSVIEGELNRLTYGDLVEMICYSFCPVFNLFFLAGMVSVFFTQSKTIRKLHNKKVF